MKAIYLALVLIIVYYLMRLHGVDPLQSIKGAVTGNPLAAAPCTLTLNQALYDSIAQEALSYIGSQQNNKYQQGSLAYIKKVLAQGMLDTSAVSEGCSKTSVTTGEKVTSIAGQGVGLAGATVSALAAHGVIAATTAATASTVILAPIALGIGIVSQIFAHHAAAMRAEQNALCTIIPAANESFATIDQAFFSGQIDLQTALAELSQEEQLFEQNVQSILKANSSQCNAACGYIRANKALVILRTQVYQSCPQAVSTLLSEEGVAA